MPIVGKILKAHGLKGELKTDCFLDSPHLFAEISEVKIKDKYFSVEKTRTSGNFVLLKLHGIDTIESASLFAGQEVIVDKDKMPLLQEGRYYIDDLVGCIVFADKIRLGKIKEILQYGAADVIVLTKEGKKILLPWVSDLFISVDTTAKLIFANKKRFDEVAVYED